MFCAIPESVKWKVKPVQKLFFIVDLLSQL
jgi:hypothetical protein